VVDGQTANAGRALTKPDPRAGRPSVLGVAGRRSRPLNLEQLYGRAPLPSVQIGRHRRFYRSELERWLARQRA
jgi:hypothetical protein